MYEMLDDTFHGILRDVYHAVKNNDRAVKKAICMTKKPDELSDEQWKTFIEKMSTEIQVLINESVKTVFSNCV